MANFQVPGDLGLTPDGRDIYLVSGEQAIAQRIDAGAQVVKGFWIYDVNEGIDYFGKVFLKGVTSSQIRDVFSSFLRSVEGVVQIISINVTTDNADREGTIEWVVRVDTGAKISGTVPFTLVQS